ncbi:MAG TPA: DUF4340 domain-containing protein, partial [Gemmatimonadaceae bacterium]|nr:DUF4340 domain-containing protein [Gemmatimonadaceae bacterium]
DRSAAGLRDRSVLRFDRDAVTRVVFAPDAGGAPVEVRRSAGGADAGTVEAWTVTAPESGPVKQWKMSSVLWALSSLKAPAPASDAPRDWSRVGLGDRARRVQLYGADGALLAELAIGSAVKGAADRVYARGNKPGLFEIETAKLTELPTRVDDVIERTATSADAGAPSP